MEPSFINSGDAARRSDTRWFRWVRILSQYQNQAAANPANDPSRLDTIRELKYKVLKAILSIATLASIVVIADTGQNSIEWTWNKTNPTSWTVQQSSDGLTGWFDLESHDPEERAAQGLTGVNYYRVVAVGGFYNGTISNVIFLPS